MTAVTADRLSRSPCARHQANILDPQNAQVWGMLCVVAVTLKKHDEADVAMKQVRSPFPPRTLASQPCRAQRVWFQVPPV